MKRKRIKIPIYDERLILYKCEDFKPLEKKYNLNDCSGYDAVTFEAHGSIIIIFSENVTPAIIAHESLHAAGYIFKAISATMDIINDEPQCYLLGWVVEQCHKFLDNN
jgi:hypothetical protein